MNAVYKNIQRFTDPAEYKLCKESIGDEYRKKDGESDEDASCPKDHLEL